MGVIGGKSWISEETFVTVMRTSWIFVLLSHSIPAFIDSHVGSKLQTWQCKLFYFF